MDISATDMSTASITTTDISNTNITTTVTKENVKYVALSNFFTSTTETTEGILTENINEPTPSLPTLGNLA